MCVKTVLLKGCVCVCIEKPVFLKGVCVCVCVCVYTRLKALSVTTALIREDFSGE